MTINYQYSSLVFLYLSHLCREARCTFMLVLNSIISKYDLGFFRSPALQCRGANEAEAKAAGLDAF
jgi:hypothetical protein